MNFEELESLFKEIFSPAKIIGGGEDWGEHLQSNRKKRPSASSDINTMTP